MNLIAFTSDEVNVFHVADEMRVRGWFVQPQLAFGASKENLHLSINPASARWVDEFLADEGRGDAPVDHCCSAAAAARLPLYMIR